MVLELGAYKVCVDIEKNKSFYKNAEMITDGCSCDGCCNYFLATAMFPEAVKEFFDQLGIDIKKAAEIIVWCSENNGKDLYYGGFYHLCGELLGGENFWKDNGRINMSEIYSIVEGYAIEFSRQVVLLEKDFPYPVIQMEIDFHNVPWVLDHKNPYR